jgi:hypothetical protein
MFPQLGFIGTFFSETEKQKHAIYTTNYSVICEVLAFYTSNAQSHKVIKYFSVENVKKKLFFYKKKYKSVYKHITIKKSQ